MRKLITGLALMPESHAIAPESAEFDVEIRRALYGRATRWRVYFTIMEDAAIGIPDRLKQSPQKETLAHREQRLF